MDLSYYMNIPEFWAGLGRAINNAGAVITGALSVTLLTLANNMAMTIIALFLFMLISVTIFIYSNQLRINEYTEDKVEQFVKIKMEDEEERFSRFSEVFSLTAREKEVLKILLSSDESAQDIADQLFISRAALYRHIGSLNEKTKTKSRIGLLQFYYTWNEAD